MIGRRGRLGRRAAIASVAFGTLLAAPGGAQGPQPAATVTANGNDITNKAAEVFAPADVAVKIGDVVAWKNIDGVAPHTVTERNGLFDLAGSYGATPVNPAGFGPGTTVARQFDAGTYQYFCRVHPTTMKGKVSVPVTLILVRRPIRHHRHHYEVDLKWGAAAPPQGNGFDVQIKRGTGSWETLRDGTSDYAGTVEGNRVGTVIAARARERNLKDSSIASDWSPEASVTS